MRAVFLYGASLLLLSACTSQVATPSPLPDVSPIAAISGSITESGESVCLPQKQGSGAQTFECAYGLKTAEGVHYALNLRENEVMAFRIGYQYTVKGVLREDPASMYDIAGVIEVESFDLSTN